MNSVDWEYIYNVKLCSYKIYLHLLRNQLGINKENYTLFIFSWKQDQLLHTQQILRIQPSHRALDLDCLGELPCWRHSALTTCLFSCPSSHGVAIVQISELSSQVELIDPKRYPVSFLLGLSYRKLLPGLLQFGSVNFYDISCSIFFPQVKSLFLCSRCICSVPALYRRCSVPALCR